MQAGAHTAQVFCYVRNIPIQYFGVVLQCVCLACIALISLGLFDFDSWGRPEGCRPVAWGNPRVVLDLHGDRLAGRVLGEQRGFLFRLQLGNKTPQGTLWRA